MDPQLPSTSQAQEDSSKPSHLPLFHVPFKETAETTLPQPNRVKMEMTRNSIVHEFEIGEIKCFLNVGMYPNGQPGELFITISKEGSTLSGALDSLAAIVSIALQHGVPLEAIVHKLAYQRFEPSGHVTNEHIEYAYSIVDYIFRWLGHAFIENYAQKEDNSKRINDPLPNR